MLYMAPRLRSQVVGELEGLAARYPASARGLVGIYTGTTMTSGAAETGLPRFRTREADPRDRVITFSDGPYGSEEAFRAWSNRASTLIVDATPGGAAAHEFGHVVMAQAGPTMEEHAFNIEQLHATSQKASSYADRNSHEFFAESFVAYDRGKTRLLSSSAEGLVKDAIRRAESSPAFTEALIEAVPGQTRAVAQARSVEGDLFGMTEQILGQLRALIEQAHERTTTALANANKDWAVRDRQAVLDSLDAALTKFNQGAALALQSGQEQAFNLGTDLVKTSGVTVSSLPHVDPGVLSTAMQTTPELIQNISRDAKSKIASMIRFAALGQTNPLDLIKQIGTVSGKGVWASAFARGEAIYRTEMGRVFNIGNYARFRQLEEIEPGWKKRWVAIHDSRTRPDHVRADGQTVGINEHFDIGGYPALYPHDPDLPARESVHCRCTVIAVRPEWESPTPENVEQGQISQARQATQGALNDFRAEMARQRQAAERAKAEQSYLAKVLDAVTPKANLSYQTRRAIAEELTANVEELAGRVEELDRLIRITTDPDTLFALQNERRATASVVEKLKRTVGLLKVGKGGAAGFAKVLGLTFGEATIAEYAGQPRDRRGRWTKGSTLAPAAAAGNTVSPREALADLAVGGQPSILPSDVGPTMEIAAKQPYDSDLTELNVNGTLKFGDDGLGIPRDRMPQLPEERREEFFDWMRGLGIDVHAESVAPESLKPTQREVSIRKAAQLYVAMKNGTFRATNRVTVSSDNFVLDGHHRWGGATALSFERHGRLRIGIDRVAMPITGLMNMATIWTSQQGIATKAMGVEAYNAAQPRDARGRWKGKTLVLSTGAYRDRNYAGLAEVFPNLKVCRLAGRTPPDVEAEVVGTLAKLGKTYPEMAEGLTEISVRNDPDLGGGIAVTHIGSGEIALNPTYWGGNGKGLRELRNRAQATGEFAGDPTPSYLVAHEYGHMATRSSFELDHARSVIAEVGADAPSFYGSFDTSEWISEAFAGVWTNSPKIKPEHRTVIDRVIGNKGEVINVFEAYNRSQPRDARGRWRGKGVPDMVRTVGNVRASAISDAQMEALGAAFPNAKIDLVGPSTSMVGTMSAEGQQAMAAALTRCGQKYPKTAATMTAIRASDTLGREENAAGATWPDHMEFDIETFGAAGFRQHTNRARSVPGWTAAGAPMTREYVVTHEFGHAIEWTADRNGRGVREWPKAAAGMNMDPASTEAAWSHDPSEGLAEIFAGTMLGNPAQISRRNARILSAMISDAEGEPQARGQQQLGLGEAYNPGQARDARGRWARQGGWNGLPPVTGEAARFIGMTQEAAEAELWKIGQHPEGPASKFIGGPGNEFACVVDPKTGKVVWAKTSGAHNEVIFTREESLAARDTIHIHNHPDGWTYPYRDPNRKGNAPSRNDILMAAGENVREVRVVTPSMTYSIRRPDIGWPDPLDLAAAGNRVEGDVRVDFMAHIRNGGGGWPSSPQARVQYANINHWDEVNTRLAKALGWSYTRTSTPGQRGAQGRVDWEGQTGWYSGPSFTTVPSMA